MGQSFSFVLDEGVYISKARAGFSKFKKHRKQLKSLGQSYENTLPPVTARSSSLGVHSKQTHEYEYAYEEILSVPYTGKNKAYNEYFEERDTIKYIRPRSVIDINLSLINSR